MEISLLLAQLIGLYLLLEGVIILTRKKFIVNIVDDLSNNKALMFVTGAMVFILGLLIVLNHNVWEASWQVIPTIVGWGMVIKGVLIFFVPNMMISWAKSFGRNRNLAVLAGVIAVVAGLYLVYVGFGLGV
ncbi:MAG: hypothetical protein CMI56_02400 [Parcubacteria group bacterium]|nr:hypothetical protein [Parcubacteria group bacterium]|tara:strand:- start:3803 stop:4195 length:393 start_codon:yes stop_codon:yes gene_type:complete